MALETRFAELRTSLRALADHAAGLRSTAVEDRAAGADASALADKIAYAADDATGWLAEAVQAADAADDEATSCDADLTALRRHLGDCQERFQRFAAGFARLNSYEHVAPVARLARQRQGQWKSWVVSLRRGLRSCQLPLDDAATALFRCWQEIAERAAAGGVSVRATNIGQKIVHQPRAPSAAAAAREGMT